MSFFRLDMGPGQLGMGPLGLTWTLLGIAKVLMTGFTTTDFAGNGPLPAGKRR